jgi:hypothetical protein
VEVSRLGPESRDRLDNLILAYPFKPYRQYRILSRRRQQELLGLEVDRALEGGGSALLADDASGCAALVLRPLSWDSEFFGVPMGRVDYLLRAGEDPRGAMAAAVAAGSEESRRRGIHHLAARVDVADMDGIEAFETHGYGLKDALISYFHDVKRERLPEMRAMGVVRPFRAEDTNEVVDIAREAYRDFRGRFHFDRHLPLDRSNELYVEWARRCCTGEMADVVYVTESSGGRLIGFSAIRKLEPVSSIGTMPLYGGGLGACRPDSHGAFGALVRAVVHDAKDRGAGLDIQTQSHNFPAVRLYEQTGFEYMRVEYTFHAWLGD